MRHNWMMAAGTVATVLLLSACGEEQEQAGPAMPLTSDDNLVEGTGAPADVQQDTGPTGSTGGPIPGHNPEAEQ